MAKNPFDQFSKQFFETFLSPYGEIKISEEVPVRAEHIRELKRNDKAYSDEESPKLWIIAPSLSETILKHYGAKRRRNWVSGIYFSSKGYHIAVLNHS